MSVTCMLLFFVCQLKYFEILEVVVWLGLKFLYYFLHLSLSLYVRFLDFLYNKKLIFFCWLETQKYFNDQ